MSIEFTMHGTINGSTHICPPQKDISQVPPEMKEVIIEDSKEHSISQLADKYNCSIAVIDFILQGH